MKKAITLADDRPSVKEGTMEYDCDYTLFEPIIQQMNEMGAPVTLYDIMELVDGKLIGTLISGKGQTLPKYTLIVDKEKLAKRLEANKLWSSDESKNPPVK